MNHEIKSPNTRIKQAVVLLSGGMDSATALAIAYDQGFACHALSFDYGQRHHVELKAARKIGQRFQVASHRWVKLDVTFGGLAGSALTEDIPVPKDRTFEQITGFLNQNHASPRHGSHRNDIPVTYVPARNTLFLSYALALSETLACTDIFIGVTALDCSGYPDCRPEFIQAFERMANLATKASVQGSSLTIHTPLIHMTKKQIVQAGLALGVDYGLTHSCYDPDDRGRACGRCDSCLLRKRAFEELGMTDPALTSCLP